MCIDNVHVTDIPSDQVVIVEESLYFLDAALLEESQGCADPSQPVLQLAWQAVEK